MTKRIIALALAIALVCMLTSCGFDAPPKIKEGKFNFSITYEEWGVEKTISGVYVCKYAGHSFALDGGNFHRSWEGHVEGIERADEIYNSAVIIRTTDDGGEIYLDFSLGAAHMMGEPHLDEVVIEPAFFLVYSNEDHTMSTTGGDTDEIEEIYGLKVVSYQYDPPIENSYGWFN